MTANDTLREALEVIAAWPVTDVKNMDAVNLQRVATDALFAAPVPGGQDEAIKAQERALRIATTTPSWGFISSYIAEARGVLDETYRFASTSPKSQQNINAVLTLLDDIEKEVGSIGAALASQDENKEQQA